MHPPARQQAGDERGRDERHVPGRGLQAGLVSLRLLQSLGLGPPVLEPDLDLGVGQLEAVGELGPLGDGEVALLNILLLQLGELLVGEGSPGLPVRLVFPQSALQWQLGHWRACVGVESLEEEGRDVEVREERRTEHLAPGRRDWSGGPGR